jgi:WD40 repeat protein
VTLSIEGEGLAHVVDVAFGKDGANLFVRREDQSTEVWDVARAVLVERTGPGRAPQTPLPEAFARERRATSGPALTLPPLDGVDDARLVAWLPTVGVKVASAPTGLSLTATSDVDLAASPDGRVLVVLRGAEADVAHRAAHTHFTVTGWNRGFSSRFGYAGDHTTWPGTVSASFGPLPDQLALVSVARQSLYYEAGVARLYDPKTGHLVADLAEESCQPNALAWSPGGKVIARNECQGARIFLSDATTGKTVGSVVGQAPFDFASDDVLAAVSGFGARVTRLSSRRPVLSVPGPSTFRAVSVSDDGSRFALLGDDGLDVLDPTGTLDVTHVDASVGRDVALKRSARGRFVSFVDDLVGHPRLVDTVSGQVETLPDRVAFDPKWERIAFVDDRGIRIRTLADGSVTEAIPISPPKATVDALAYAPSGAWVVAMLSDASMVFVGASGHIQHRVPALEKGRCGTHPELHFPGPDVVSVGCAEATHALSIPSGTPVSDPVSEPPGAPAPVSFPPPFVAALLDETKRGSSMGGKVLLTALDPPLVVRASDDRIVSLHVFAYGEGRAVVVLDDRGQWDANALGASLVHVATDGRDDDAEKARRRAPGLLAAFVRGDGSP